MALSFGIFDGVYRAGYPAARLGAGRLAAVSYTHLDVYKRQGIGLYALRGFGGFGSHLTAIADMRAQIQLFAAFRACLPMVVIVALPYIVDEMAKRNFHRCAFRLGRGGLAVGCANLYGCLLYTSRCV